MLCPQSKRLRKHRGQRKRRKNIAELIKIRGDKLWKLTGPHLDGKRSMVARTLWRLLARKCRGLLKLCSHEVGIASFDLEVVRNVHGIRSCQGQPRAGSTSVWVGLLRYLYLLFHFISALYHFRIAHTIGYPQQSTATVTQELDDATSSTCDLRRTFGLCGLARSAQSWVFSKKVKDNRWSTDISYTSRHTRIHPIADLTPRIHDVHCGDSMAEKSIAQNATQEIQDQHPLSVSKFNPRRLTIANASITTNTKGTLQTT